MDFLLGDSQAGATDTSGIVLNDGTLLSCQKSERTGKTLLRYLPESSACGIERMPLAPSSC